MKRLLKDNNSKRLQNYKIMNLKDSLKKANKNVVDLKIQT